MGGFDFQEFAGKCPYCGARTQLFFCPNCGSVLKYPRFIETDKAQKRRFQSLIKALVNDANKKNVNLSKYADVKLLSDEAFHKYNERVLYLQNKQSKSGDVPSTGQESQSLTELMRGFAEKCKKSDFQIAVFGRIGSGKSTLINALLGKEVYSTDCYSETTVLTKIRCSVGEDYLKVSYYTIDEWNELWKSADKARQNSIRNDQEDFLSQYHKLGSDRYRNQLLNKQDEIIYASDEVELRGLINRYISCKNPCHFFVKEIEIGLKTFPIPKNVVLIDTLGIDDPVGYRTSLSNRYLATASIALLCIKATNRQLCSYELKEITKLFNGLKLKEKVFVLGTQYDIPGNFPKYWKEKTKPELMMFFSPLLCCGISEKRKDRIFPVSAWYYNIIQKAKNEETFGNNECDVDNLAEVLCRCLGRQLAYQYGTNNDALKNCMNEYLVELESMTNVPNVSDVVVFGSVIDDKRKTFEDLKNIYLNIFNKLKKKTVQPESEYGSTIKSQLLALESRMAQNHKKEAEKEKYINSILRSLQQNN